MKRDLSFLSGLTDEDEVLLSKILNWAEMAQEKYITKFSFFLDERQCALCEKVLDSVKFRDRIFWGGYDEAQRKVLCIKAPYSNVSYEDFPVTPLTFTFRKEDKLSHRDFLGALMSQMIDRDCVGDIVVNEGKAAVFLMDTVAQDIIYSLNKIGRVGVKCEVGFDPAIKPEISFKEMNGTVASLRIDCVAALALRLSREKTAALIKSGALEINHVRTQRPDTAVNEGDSFSVRGYGKFLLRSINGRSNKDRSLITVCKYI